MRLSVANKMHNLGEHTPVAYLLACCEPADTAMGTWALPEPVLYDSLPGLNLEQAGQRYTVVIHADKQRIECCTASPDLAPYYRRIRLQRNEMLLLEKSREADAFAKSGRNVRSALATAARLLTEAGEFDPNGVVDSATACYSRSSGEGGGLDFANGCWRRTVTGVLLRDAMWRRLWTPRTFCPIGSDTDHPANGIILRTDLHTLFDLGLIAIAAETMTVIVSPELTTSYYGRYSGRRSEFRGGANSQPSLEALRRHREESGLGIGR